MYEKYDAPVTEESEMKLTGLITLNVCIALL